MSANRTLMIVKAIAKAISALAETLCKEITPSIRCLTLPNDAWLRIKQGDGYRFICIPSQDFSLEVKEGENGIGIIVLSVGVEAKQLAVRSNLEQARSAMADMAVSLSEAKNKRFGTGAFLLFIVLGGLIITGLTRTVSGPTASMPASDDAGLAAFGLK
jgi:hypothetical protein